MTLADKTSIVINVSNITDSISNITAVENHPKLNLDNANITITGTITKSDYENADSYTKGTVSFTKIKDTYIALKSIDSVLAGKTVTISNAVTIAQLGEIREFIISGPVPGTVSYSVEDTNAVLKESTSSDLTNAKIQ